MTSLRTTLLLLGCLILSLKGFSQNVTILPGGITPMQSGSYPRLSYDEIAALTSSQEGDIAYDTTFKCLRLYNGTKWVRLVSDDENMPSITAWSAGGTKYEESISIVLDLNKNIYITGHFRDTTTFNGTDIISAGGADIFIAKFNNSGVLQWIKTAGGNSDDTSNDIAVDGNGNIYITGMFQSTSNFDATTLISAGAEDFYIAKYDSLGTMEWVQQGSGNFPDIGVDIIAEPNGDVYVTGFFNATTTFGSTPLISSGGSDVFFAKYNTSGVLQWIQKVGGSNMDFAYSIKVDGSGFVYLTGIYVNGSTKIGSTTLSNSGSTDIFMAKYNPVNSSWVWAQKIGGSGHDAATAITLDNTGNIYLTGHFENTVNFGSNSINSSGNRDGFIVKYDASGNYVWVRKMGGVNEDDSNDMEIDGDGNVYVTGFFNDTANFQTTTRTSAGESDIFIAKYKATGALVWVQRLGDIGIDVGGDLTIDSDKNIYATGVFQETVKFGNTNLISNGDKDIFVARIKE